MTVKSFSKNSTFSLFSHLENTTEDSFLKILFHEQTKTYIGITEKSLFVYENVLNHYTNGKSIYDIQNSIKQSKSSESETNYTNHTINDSNNINENNKNFNIEQSLDSNENTHLFNKENEITNKYDSIYQSNENNQNLIGKNIYQSNPIHKIPHFKKLFPLKPIISKIIFSNDDLIIDFALDESHIYIISESGRLLVYSVRDLSSKTQSSLRCTFLLSHEPSVIRIVTIPPFMKGKKKKTKVKSKNNVNNNEINLFNTSDTKYSISQIPTVNSSSNPNEMQPCREEKIPISDIQINSFPNTNSTIYQNFSGKCILINLENGSFIILHYDITNEKIIPIYQSPESIHSNISSDLALRSRTIVSCGMDYKIIQYSIDDQNIISSFDIQNFINNSLTRSQGSITDGKIFNPPHPHSLSLSEDLTNEKGQPRFGLVGLGNGDVFCLDLDQSFVLKWISHAHNYIVSYVQFLPTEKDENNILQFITASNDGYIHFYKIPFPKKLKERYNWTEPILKIHHSEEALKHLAHMGIINQENIEYYSSVCSQINHIQLQGKNIVVSDESGQAYCYIIQ